MYSIYYFILGLIISYLYSVTILPKQSGQSPKLSITCYPLFYRGMIMIPISSTKALHIHHWICYSILCIYSLFYYLPVIIIGFSSGLMIQGLYYSDRFTIICQNPYE